jgi:hypothetical protein
VFPQKVNWSDLVLHLLFFFFFFDERALPFYLSLLSTFHQIIWLWRECQLFFVLKLNIGSFWTLFAGSNLDFYLFIYVVSKISGLLQLQRTWHCPCGQQVLSLTMFCDVVSFGSIISLTDVTCLKTKTKKQKTL